MRKKMIALIAVGFSVGCTVGTAPTDPEPTTPQMVTRTSVHLMPDGNHQVEVTKIPLEEAARQYRLRLVEREKSGRIPNSDRLGAVSQGIGKDSGCASSSLWVYSETSCPAYPYAEICFWGTGSVSLNNYRFFGDTGPYWGGNVRSFWPGQDTGAFYQYSAPWLYQAFDPYGSCINADSNGQAADTVCLGC